MSPSPTDHLGQVRRSVSTVTRDGGELRLLTVERTLDARAAEVWSALTTAERIARWWRPVSGDLEVGGRYRLDGQASGEVLDCVPTERLALTWEDDGRVSWVDLSLRPTDAGTLLQLDHAVPADDPAYAELGPGGSGTGWEVALAALAEHLADPGADPGADRVEPSTEFLAGSGAAWREAAAEARA